MQRGVRDLEATADHDLYQASIFHSNLAVFSTACDDITTARTEADVALGLARQIDNPTALSSALWASGKALVRADPPASLAAYEAYVVMARSGAHSGTLGWSLGDVAWLKARAGDRLGALRAARDGVRHDLRSGNRTMLAGAMNRTKLAFVELGYPEPAAVLAGAETDGPLATWKVNRRRKRAPGSRARDRCAPRLARRCCLRARRRPGRSHDLRRGRRLRPR